MSEPICHLNELREICDYYENRAALALNRHFICPKGTWPETLDRIRKDPHGDSRADLDILLRLIYEQFYWAQITRFLYFCDLIFEEECRALAIVQTTWGKEAYGSTAATTA